MKVYSYRTLYAIPFIRRWRYKAGHGVHSPLAYHLINDVVGCPYSFYGYEEIKGKLPNLRREEVRVGKLLFKLIAHMGQGVYFYHVDRAHQSIPIWGVEASPLSRHKIFSSEGQIKDIQHYVDGYVRDRKLSTRVEYSSSDKEDELQQLFCYCSSPELALDYLNTNTNPEKSERKNLLVDGLRRDQKSYQTWKDLAYNHPDAKIIIDLYHCAIIVTGSRLNKQICRGYIN